MKNEINMLQKENEHLTNENKNNVKIIESLKNTKKSNTKVNV